LVKAVFRSGVLARIRIVLRRGGEAPATILQVHDLKLDQSPASSNG